MHRIVFALLAFVAAASAQCSGGIPAGETRAFLSAHNSLRQKISSGGYVAKGRRMPAARTPIPALKWDCGLEKSAQQWADRCSFTHSKSGNGENLYMMSASNKLSFSGMGAKASASWANEFQEKGWPSVKLTSTLFNSGVGHATQMAWAKSTRIGCGMASCKGGKQVLVVCHYNPRGNFMNQNIYDPKSDGTSFIEYF